jgi:hypothetical protein
MNGSPAMLNKTSAMLAGSGTAAGPSSPNDAAALCLLQGGMASRRFRPQGC